MVHVQPTVHESNQFSRTGKLPDSLKERRRLAESTDVEALNEVSEAYDSQHPNHQVAIARLQELRTEARKAPNQELDEGGEGDAPLDPAKQNNRDPERLDLSELSVPDIKEQVAQIDDPQALTEMLEAEQSGKDRKTAVSSIEERIEELDEGGEG